MPVLLCYLNAGVRNASARSTRVPVSTPDAAVLAPLLLHIALRDKDPVVGIDLDTKVDMK